MQTTGFASKEKEKKLPCFLLIHPVVLQLCAWKWLHGRGWERNTGPVWTIIFLGLGSIFVFLLFPSFATCKSKKKNKMLVI